MGRLTPLVWHLEPPALPVFDPEWSRQCLNCRHVQIDFGKRHGNRELRCAKTKLMGSGGKNFQIHAYCIDTLDAECKENKWYEPA